MSTVRFDGLYQSGDLWFRFRPGNIVEARFIDDDPTPSRAAHLVARGNGGLGPGSYQLKGNAIDLSVRFPSGENRYKGQVGDDFVELTYVAKGQKTTPERYVFHPLSEAELADGHATRVYDLREQLKKNAVNESAVEAAAALGDPVALAAIHPPDIDETAKRLAANGPQACVRALLAMCWLPDGQVYYPKQSEVTDATRKTDEGKVLRALAQWCVKPDDKSLLKIKAEFLEMERMGNDYKFMQLVMATIHAKTEAERAKTMKELLTFHIDEDIQLAFDAAREQVTPWLLGMDDPLAAKLKRIK